MNLSALTGILGRTRGLGRWKPVSTGKQPGSRRLAVEPLEDRRLLSLGGLSAAEAVPGLDCGDAPDNYATTLATDGARHTATGPTLGALRDSEADGLPTPTADGDDTAASDDEDGVTFGSAIMVGQLDASVTVNVQNAPTGAKLDAWIDFNADGSWGGPGERIADGVDVIEGDNTIQFDVPSWAADGPTYARFRLSTAGGLAPTGAVSDGEVEDHQVTIMPPAPGSGDFVAHEPLTGEVAGPTAIFSADVDSDGDMDVLSASEFDDKIAWYENNGEGGFTFHTITTSANGARSVFATDVDGDGDTDVLSASSFSDKIAWYENDGNEHFTAHTITTSADGAFSVFAADLDADGDMDVLSASGGGNKIAWYENNGNERFTVHTITSSAAAGTSVFAADLDGDDDMDVLSAHSGNRIAWYENDGGESFTTHTITTSANYARSVFAADVDSDGDIDVLSASLLDDKIAWYENDGDENFTPRIITTSTSFAQSVFAADLDGDGDTDVLSASSGEVAWYENDGNESFTAHTIAATAFSAQSPFAADVDGDGDVDVLSAWYDDDKISWYENDGNEQFTAHTITTFAGWARSVFAADVDGDGDLDVLSASAEDNKIAWYENLGNESPDLGTVDFLGLPNLDSSAGRVAYSLTTANDGYLTVDATFDLAAGTVGLELLDASDTPVGTLVAEDGYVRLDHLDPTGLNEYTLRLTGTNPSVDLRICNLISPSGPNVEVFGTEGEDAFGFAVTDTYDVSANGVEYHFDLASTDYLVFMGSPGSDTATLTGGPGVENVNLSPGQAELRRVGTTFSLHAIGIENVTVNGGGGDDVVEIFDSTGDDTLVATPSQFRLTGTPEGGEAFSLTANSFPYAHAYAKNGGLDAANFTGSDAKDRLKIYPDYLKMIGGTFYNRAKFFESYTADGLGDPNDRALVYGSDATDVLWAAKNDLRVDYAAVLELGQRPPFENLNYDVLASGFENVRAYADGDPNDWAELHASSTADVFIAKPHKVQLMNGPRKADGVLRGEEYEITARGFRNVTAIGDAEDTAKLYDSADAGTDVWSADYRDGATWSSMSSPDRLLYEVLAFGQVGGYGFNGGLGPNHGLNAKNHTSAVDFTFQYGYWDEGYFRTAGQ